MADDDVPPPVPHNPIEDDDDVWIEDPLSDDEEEIEDEDMADEEDPEEDPEEDLGEDQEEIFVEVPEDLPQAPVQAEDDTDSVLSHETDLGPDWATRLEIAELEREELTQTLHQAQHALEETQQDLHVAAAVRTSLQDALERTQLDCQRRVDEEVEKRRDAVRQKEATMRGIERADRALDRDFDLALEVLEGLFIRLSMQGTDLRTEIDAARVRIVRGWVLRD